MVFSLGLGVFSLSAQDFNPFETPKANSGGEPTPPPQSTTLDTYEFNGIISIDGVTRISVFDTKQKRNFWLEVGEQAENGVVLRRYDPQAETVVISIGGTNKQLAMKSAKITPLKIASPAVASGDQTVAPQVPADVRNGQNERVGESDEEVRERMKRVAEEIRRRRAERRARLQERTTSN
ncbi:hypothetical protein QEH54_08075 [Pelagicoccus sp. SDUM812003]|nr:hypothetical protein [Pelagicoccus sp. SDUM812003]